MPGETTTLRERHIYVEGAIGGGKSFLVKSLETEILRRVPNSKVIVYHEAPDKFWLERFNTNQVAFETAFQVSMIIKRYRNRVKSYVDSEKDREDAKKRGGIPAVVFYIHDTGLISNKAFIWANFKTEYIKEPKRDLLLQVESAMEEDMHAYMPKPDHLILLDCTAERSLENIKRRGRDTEEKLPARYLKNLSESYKELFGKLNSDIRKHVIDVSNEFADANDILAAIGV